MLHMSSPLTLSKWATFLLINVLVTLGTMFIFMRVLSQEPAQRLPPVPTATNAPAVSVPASGLAVGTESSTVSTTGILDLPQPTTSPANASATRPAAGVVKVRISAVQFSGQRTRESVSILNEGDQVDLSGWTVVAPNGATYAFKNFVLFKDSFITLYSTNGSDSPTSLFWNQTDAMWKKGDTALLKQGESVVSTYVVK
jgi:hypothetical protein